MCIVLRYVIQFFKNNNFEFIDLSLNLSTLIPLKYQFMLNVESNHGRDLIVELIVRIYENKVNNK